MKASRRNRIPDADEPTAKDEMDEFGMKSVVKPDDQLVLTDEEMKEEITRILTANNPHAPQNIIRFNFKDFQYKPIPNIDQMAVHFSLEGNLLHKDSDDAKRQLSSDAPEDDAIPSTPDEEGPPDATESGNLTGPSTGEKKLTNQFNFCERSTQTYNNELRERGSVTEPPPRSNFGFFVTQWIMQDDYQQDHEKQQNEKADDKKAGQFSQTKKTSKKTNKRTHTTNDNQQGDELAKFENPIRIIERMINQNTYDDIAQDFRYYEDASDDFRDMHGTLLPLWRFGYEKARRLTVTCISWCPGYFDLFAVGLGSYDFTKQMEGMICFHSLKNPGHPEFVFKTHCGVLSLDLHPQLPNLLCVGFYDGAVGIYNVHQSKYEPLYLSTAKTGKHTDPVWEVRWIADSPSSDLKFFSISADGRVTTWTLIKQGIGQRHNCPNELIHYDVLKLKLISKCEDQVAEAQITTFDCGTTFDIHPTLSHLFLVGTEEGLIHKCSRAYQSEYLKSYTAHHMAVYRVKWNVFHPDLFISCSADWSVKVWDHNKSRPIFVYDLGAPVGDVAWAPYSSTVFAAVTSDGKAHVFDLNLNKYEALCSQVIVQKSRAKLTHIAFNPKHPLIVVGDDHGHTISLKLSPNLRKPSKEKKAGEVLKGREAELYKLEKLLALVG